MSGTPSSGLLRAMSTGNLLADCERWCRDNLRRHEAPAQSGTTLRLVAVPAAEPALARRGDFRVEPDWPGIALTRTGS